MKQNGKETPYDTLSKASSRVVDVMENLHGKSKDISSRKFIQ
jgi:hypothetical protein